MTGDDTSPMTKGTIETGGPEKIMVPDSELAETDLLEPPSSSYHEGGSSVLLRGAEIALASAVSCTFRISISQEDHARLGISNVVAESRNEGAPVDTMADTVQPAFTVQVNIYPSGAVRGSGGEPTPTLPKCPRNPSLPAPLGALQMTTSELNANKSQPLMSEASHGDMSQTALAGATEVNSGAPRTRIRPSELARDDMNLFASEKPKSVVRQTEGALEISSEEGWSNMDKQLRKYDEDQIKDYKEDIDTLLVFAGLFSAVLTAFNVVSYPMLQPDASGTSVCLLAGISKQLDSFSTNGGFLNSTAPSQSTLCTAGGIQAIWKVHFAGEKDQFPIDSESYAHLSRAPELRLDERNQS